ncbi:sialate O-acetylesterase [Sinomicrobium oceani]|uniref:Sialate O-acetylesterase n=1 Tax=Sinomicrobium oceani TaxID=1150368 RepID=A0A1K1NTS6_9FLAO|nr:sialate O-acetylesterase [Sinomicrobium oceani]SFW38635.1 sialate O-acetylesterase [Sinomicrobium oceani]
MTYKHYRSALCLIVSCLFTAVSFGQIRLPRLISDGMVLQRDQNVRVWGWASPGESVKLTLDGKTVHTKTDEDGAWEMLLPAMKAGGPYTITLEGQNRIVLKNVVFGEVWVCSGQSNMELTMARVRDNYADVVQQADMPDIRQFLVPDQFDFKKENKDLEEGYWESASPDNISGFSAVAYFFALELYAKYQVPIGLINAALGGSPVEAWMSEEALKDFPDSYAELQKFKDDALIRKIETEDRERAAAWHDTLNKKDRGFTAPIPWSETDVPDKDWDSMEIPGFWANKEQFRRNEEGHEVFQPGHTQNGVVWFRKTIDLTADKAGKPASLWMGRIVDQDYTYVNGQQVGTTGYQYPPRKYTVAPGILKEGRNVITIRVINNGGKGGFVKDKPYFLAIDGDTIDLKGLWKYKPGVAMSPMPGQTFVRWKPGGLYNKMIAPLLPYTIRGIIWYQGESNTGDPGKYARTFPAMIKSWRKAWKQGDFPFLYVQLANFMEETDTPVESNWAVLRQAQLQALSLPETGMAIITDIGEWNDIHPLNKKDVGYRLALLARKIAYKEKGLTASGPIATKAAFKRDQVSVTFDAAGRGLTTRDGNTPQYFALSEDGKTFVWAKAEITGKNTVRVWNNRVKYPVAVRYAWANNPATANLYSEDGLPASPFELRK